MLPVTFCKLFVNWCCADGSGWCGQLTISLLFFTILAVVMLTHNPREKLASSEGEDHVFPSLLTLFSLNNHTDIIFLLVTFSDWEMCFNIVVWLLINCVHLVPLLMILISNKLS